MELTLNAVPSKSSETNLKTTLVPAFASAVALASAETSLRVSGRALRFVALLLIGLIALGASACERFYGTFIGEPRADVESPQRHVDDRVQFNYPGNWDLKSESNRAGSLLITTRQIKSKGSAFIVVQSFPPLTPVPLDEYLVNFLRGMTRELDSGWMKMLKHTQEEATPIKRKVFGKMCEGRRFSWEVSVLNEKTPFVIEIISAPTPKGVVYVIVQLPVKGADAARPGADLILDSLKLSAGSQR